VGVKVSGTKTRTLIELTVDELAIEGQYLMDRAILEQEKLVANGVAPRVATATVLKQIGTESEFVRAWMNKNERIIDELHSQLVAKPIRQVGLDNPEQLWLWELDSGAKHCGDCIVMADAPPRTIEEILDEGVGLPRDGDTQCNVGCKCQLVPA